MKNKLKWKQGICGVERYTDGNKSVKKVFYCNQCKIWMCVKCSHDIVKRVMALINRDLSKKVSI